MYRYSGSSSTSYRGVLIECLQHPPTVGIKLLLTTRRREQAAQTVCITL